MKIKERFPILLFILRFWPSQYSCFYLTHGRIRNTSLINQHFGILFAGWTLWLRTTDLAKDFGERFDDRDDPKQKKNKKKKEWSRKRYLLTALADI